jgi:hypothetical protein
VLRIAQSRDAAMTQVTFKRADVEAELERRIDEKVKARTAELEAKVAAMQQQMDAELPKLADGLIAARILQRRELRTLDAIERNDDNVVVETKDVLFLGDDAFVTFEIENRNKAPYRVATVAMRDGTAGHRRRRPLHQRRRRDRRRRRRSASSAPAAAARASSSSAAPPTSSASASRS